MLFFSWPVQLSPSQLLSDMKTKKQLIEFFECTEEQANRILQIQEVGKRHGTKGWYRDSDFSSDADWCNGVGAEIFKLGIELGVNDELFDIYSAAHGHSLRLNQN